MIINHLKSKRGLIINHLKSKRGKRKKESIKLSGVKGVGRGEGGGGYILNPLPSQCIFCGKDFKNPEEKDDHIKKVHPSKVESGPT